MTPGADRVLAGLRQAGNRSCSGQSLSDELGVSRNQVWKHVQALRRRGYGIEGEPGGGYRLVETPDRLYPEEIAAHLETTWIARSVEYFDETESTNTLAFERGREGAPAGHTVIAERQTAGRGRLGRSFNSPPNLNLYTSILLRPTLPISEAPTLIHATAVGCANAIAEALSDPTAIESDAWRHWAFLARSLRMIERAEAGPRSPTHVHDKCAPHASRFFLVILLPSMTTPAQNQRCSRFGL